MNCSLHFLQMQALGYLSLAALTQEEGRALDVHLAMNCRLNLLPHKAEEEERVLGIKCIFGLVTG